MSAREKSAPATDDASWDDAVDWLLNSRWVEPPVVDHFFHLSGGEECDCELD